MNPTKTGVELMCSGRISSSCFTNGTRRVTLVTNPVISHEWGKEREVFTTSGAYPWSFVTQMFRKGKLLYTFHSQFLFWIPLVIKTRSVVAPCRFIWVNKLLLISVYLLQLKKTWIHLLGEYRTTSTISRPDVIFDLYKSLVLWRIY